MKKIIGQQIGIESGPQMCTKTQAFVHFKPTIQMDGSPSSARLGRKKKPMKHSSDAQDSNAPLIDRDYTLQRFDGKGRWTYAEIPEIAPDPHAYFGWVRVKGSIDHYSLSNYRLQPMGNGHLFMPVNAKVRKLIGKEAGDVVRITLYRDELPVEVREELLACLSDEPAALKQFNELPQATQNAHLDFIFDAKTEPIKIERIARVIDNLLNR